MKMNRIHFVNEYFFGYLFKLKCYYSMNINKSDSTVRGYYPLGSNRVISVAETSIQNLENEK